MTDLPKIKVLSSSRNVTSQRERAKLFGFQHDAVYEHDTYVMEVLGLQARLHRSIEDNHFFALVEIPESIGGIADNAISMNINVDGKVSIGFITAKDRAVRADFGGYDPYRGIVFAMNETARMARQIRDLELLVETG